MPLHLFRLHFHAPLHIGNARADYGQSGQVFHSDSLYAAIIQAWAVLGLPMPDETGDPGFALSSLFPFGKSTKDEPLYFFPKPIEALKAEDYHYNKLAKKIRYLDTESFVKTLRGENATYGNSEEINRHGAFYSAHLQKEKARIFHSEVNPRVYVPRYGETDKDGKRVEDTSIYYVERLFFEKGCGLFCLVQADEASLKKVRAALSYLQDEGIGTDRHVGNGLFTLQESTFNAFDALPASDYGLNLSLFCPESQAQLQAMIEENAGADQEVKSAYELIRRGGWITTEPHLSLRKKSVYMFKEGGLLRIPSDTSFSEGIYTSGKTVNLRPDNDLLEHSGVAKVEHPVWRSGKALFVPFQLNS